MTRRRIGQRRSRNSVRPEVSTRPVSSLETKESQHEITNNSTKMGRHVELGVETKDKFLYSGPTKLGLVLKEFNIKGKAQMEPHIWSSPSVQGKNELARSRVAKSSIRSAEEKSEKQNLSSSSSWSLLSNKGTKGFNGPFQFTASSSIGLGHQVQDSPPCTLKEDEEQEGLLRQGTNGFVAKREMGPSKNSPSFLNDYEEVRDQPHEEGTKLVRNGASSDLVLKERANKGETCDDQMEVEEGGGLANST